MNEVVVTGIGFASCIGIRRQQVLNSLRELRHGFSCRCLDSEGMAPPLVCGRVPGFDVDSVNPLEWTLPRELEIGADRLKGLPPHAPYVIHALDQALQQSGIETQELNQPGTGLYAASNGSPRLLHHHLGRMQRSKWHRIT